MFCQFLLHSKLPSLTHKHTHTHTHILFFNLSCSNTSEYIKFPVLYSRFSLFIHSKCNSLCLLIPDSISIPIPPPPSWQPQSVLQVQEFLFCGKFHLWYILDSRLSDIIWHLPLSDLLHLVWESLVPSMLLKMAIFCSFSWLGSIP